MKHKVRLRKENFDHKTPMHEFHVCVPESVLSKLESINWNQDFEYWIPESCNGLNEGSGYNMVIATKIGFVLVNSVDFDFIDEEE